MRWPFGPPHLTLKPSKIKQQNKTKTKKNKRKKRKKKEKKKKRKKRKKRKKKKKKEKKKKKKRKKHKKYQKWAFQLSIKFFFFWWVSKFSLFWHLDPKSAHPKQHYKNRGFSKFFLKSRCASRIGHFWTKQNPNQKFQLSFFCLFLLFQQQKHKNVLKPLFYSVLGNPKRRMFKC